MQKNGHLVRFGLQDGQQRRNALNNNGGWYLFQPDNYESTERIGRGDLDADDLRRIADKVAGGEYFLVLGRPDEDFHDPNCGDSVYVMEHAGTVIGKDQFYLVGNYGSNSGAVFVDRRSGIEFKTMDRQILTKRLNQMAYLLSTAA